MNTSLKVNDFNYFLPEELIATSPVEFRDQSRLLVVENNSLNDSLISVNDLLFNQLINYIKPNDLIIFNNSKVIKARLFGQKSTGGKIELLIERILDSGEVIAHVRSNKTINPGLNIILPNDISLTVTEKLEGIFKLVPNQPLNWIEYLDQHGHIPLPPYMKRSSSSLDDSRYQTVYAKDHGSVAAPTAGLHFTTQLLEQIQNVGAKIAYVTLHVGSGTFKPVSAEFITEHKMHSEVFSITDDTLKLIFECKKKGGNVIAVGTTSLRTLETIARDNFTRLNGETDIFITPGFEFKLVDKLITNFHLPKSTLLMLVSAFSGFGTIRQVYKHAIGNKYRFFSYGDAMLLTRNNKKEQDMENKTTHFGFKNVDETKKADLVANVFHSVAKNYDIMNDVMSMGLHRLWKKFTLFTAEIKTGSKVLDIAGGTGDMAKGFKQLVGETGEVWHTDINSSMLKVGRDRLFDEGIITPQCLCDAEKLPFIDNYFDAVCVSFGLRNMTHKDLALKEIHRVLKPGGILFVLEFSKVHKPLEKLYDLYSFKFLPFMGKLIAKDSESYTYLAESIRMHPDQETLKQMMFEAGFAKANYHNFTFGITALHKGYKA